VAAAADPGARATVAIGSEPPDASVRWNGQVLGQTPLRIELPRGTQIVVLSRAGCFDETLTLALSASETVERFVQLRKRGVPMELPRPHGSVGERGRMARTEEDP
jgi:serine/threonine-protein kinase